MRGKILDCGIIDFSDTKMTYVRKETKYGTFTGNVVLQPEDADVASDTLGYNFAEEKCDIQALKARAKRFLERAKGMEHLYTTLTANSSLSSQEDEKKVKRQVDLAWKRYREALDSYQASVDTYDMRIENLLNYKRRLRERKN